MLRLPHPQKKTRDLGPAKSSSAHFVDIYAIYIFFFFSQYELSRWFLLSILHIFQILYDDLVVVKRGDKYD